MRYDLGDGVWLDLDTMELWIMPVALTRRYPGKLAVIDIIPALEAAYDRYVAIPPDQVEADYEEGGEG